MITEKKTYRDEKPFKYHITLNGTRYTYYYGQKVVRCKNKGSLTRLCDCRVDLETGEHFNLFHAVNVDPDWDKVRDKFKNFQ